MSKVILETEELCVDYCVQLSECIAVTFVGPNPSQYLARVQGCYAKAGGWTVKNGTDFQANMVSVNVICVRQLISEFSSGWF